MSETAITTFVRELGNHPYTLCVWVVVGVVSGFLFPIFWREGENAQVFSGIIGACIAMALYAVAYKLIRPLRVMRRRDRGWAENFGCNGVVTLMTVAVGLARHEHLTGSEVWCQVFLALATFVLMEIVRPYFDYGVLQFFLRLPLQCSSVLVFVKGEGSWILVVVTLILYIGCSLWGFYYVTVYEEGLRAAERLLPDRVAGTHSVGVDASRGAGRDVQVPLLRDVPVVGSRVDVSRRGADGAAVDEAELPFILEESVKAEIVGRVGRSG